MRNFAPLADTDLPVPASLLDALVDIFGPPGDWVVIGATARDLAPLELIAILKMIAFSDRYPGESRDAEDLRLVQQAASHGIFGEEIWEDDDAMAAVGFDHELAGAYRLGRRGLGCFTSARAQMVLSLATSTEDTLRFAGHREQHVLLEAWRAGLRRERLGAEGRRRGTTYE